MNKLEIIAIQSILGLKLTGIYDSDTKSAVIDFQRKYGLVRDGIVGSKTRRALLSALGDKTRSTQRYLVDRVIKYHNKGLSTDWIYTRIKSMFSDRSDDKLRIGLARILADRDALQLFTLTHIAYFLGNVREEVGYNFNDKENLDYSDDSLIETFSFFKRYPRLARRYGRTKYHKASQVMIANCAYANRYGNGGVKSNDGWIYRGSGAMQITFKDNNIAINEYAKNECKQSYPDFVSDPESKITSQYSLVSGALYWGLNDIGRLIKSEELDVETSYAITARINRYTRSYDKRWKHTKKFAKLLGLKVHG
jgi:predicted chitinase